MIDYEKLKDDIQKRMLQTKEAHEVSSLALSLSTVVRTQEAEIEMSRRYKEWK